MFIYCEVLFLEELSVGPASVPGSGFAGPPTPQNNALSARGTAGGKGFGVWSGCHSAHMSQPNRVGRRISPRSLAGHERLPVRLSHVGSAKRYMTDGAKCAPIQGAPIF